MEPWDERSDGTAVEISFEGFDAEKRDDEEAREFVTAVTRPKDASVWFAGRWVPTSATIFKLFLLGVLLSYPVCGILASMGADVSFTSYVGLWLVAFLSPFLVGRLVATLRRPKLPTLETGRFTLRLDAPGLSVTGAASGVRTLPLGEIDRFEGNARLTVVKQDGTRERLACSLVAASRHAALAARLDEVLRSVRSATAGYRGVRVAQEDGLRGAKQTEPDAEGEAAPGSDDRERHETS